MSELENVEMTVGREDWEKFLSSIERLTTLHNKVLQRLDELNTRNEALRKELQEIIAQKPAKEQVKIPVEPETPPATPTISTYPSIHAGNGVNESRVIQRLRQWLKTGPSTTAPTPQTPSIPNLHCGDCGHEVTKPSVFCQHCGASFGGLYCQCGRQLQQDDKFCDRCGQKLDASSLSKLLQATTLRK